ncbi:DUF397 domain-containing protein [Sphaerisporangium aureirubrum]
MEFSNTRWTRSSYSGSNGGNCVEVARLSSGHRGVRDSKDPVGAVLLVTGRQWSIFVAGIKRYDF